MAVLGTSESISTTCELMNNGIITKALQDNLLAFDAGMIQGEEPQPPIIHVTGIDNTLLEGLLE